MALGGDDNNIHDDSLAALDAWVLRGCPTNLLSACQWWTFGSEFLMVTRRRTPVKTSFQTAVGLALLTVGFLATLGTLLGFFGSYWWAFDLMANFRLQYAIVLVVTAIGYALLMGKGLAVAFLLVAGVNVALIVPLYTREPMETAGNDELRIVSFNVEASTVNQDKVLAWMNGLEADIVVLLESSEDWESSIEETNVPYSIKSDLPQDRRYGITVLGKGADATELHRIGEAEDPVVRIESRLNGEPVVVYAVHPRPGTSEDGAALRNEVLEQVADLVQQETTPVVVIGDLNATPWSAAFRQLQTDANLVNSLDGYGFQATWPAGMPFGLSIPIDHMLHTPELTTSDRVVGPDLGSDHLPLLVTVGHAQP